MGMGKTHRLSGRQTWAVGMGGAIVLLLTVPRPVAPAVRSPSASGLGSGPANFRPNVVPSSISASSVVAVRPDGRWQVERVIDGDTLWVRRGGERLKVRVLGINAPESVDPRRPVQCFGLAAAARARDLLEGQTVTLYKDALAGDSDRYGRALRYVILADGTDFGFVMLQDGYAYDYSRLFPDARAATYQAAVAAARQSGQGLWAPGACP